MAAKVKGSAGKRPATATKDQRTTSKGRTDPRPNDAALVQDAARTKTTTRAKNATAKPAGNKIAPAKAPSKPGAASSKAATPPKTAVSAAQKATAPARGKASATPASPAARPTKTTRKTESSAPAQAKGQKTAAPTPSNTPAPVTSKTSKTARSKPASATKTPPAIKAVSASPAAKKPKAAKKDAAQTPVALTASPVAVKSPPQHATPSASAPPGKDEQDVFAVQSLDIEKLATNLARVVENSGKALAAYLQPREKGEKKENPDGVVDLVKTLGHVAEYWLKDPQRTYQAQSAIAKGYMDLWTNTLKTMSGETAPPVVSPSPADKRFKDPEWSSNPVFDFMKQFYLVTSNWAEELVKEAEIEPHLKHKASFYTKQITGALSPSNFAITNPEVLRETFKTNGENLVRGTEMLAEDIALGHGDLKIRQSDETPFEMGRNIAVSPGKVIYENDLMQLLQYEPSTPTVGRIPLLIIPPWINKFYILDLSPEKSFIKWAVDQGLSVFVVSWVNPDARLAKKSFAEYIKEGPLAAIDVINQVTGIKEVHTIGYCVGGTLMACTLGYMADKGDTRIVSNTFFTTQVDFTYAGDLLVFADEENIASVERQMQETGYLEGSRMANAFNMLRSNDLIWPYVVNNYLKGKKPMPFDLLYWNADSTRMPAANHSFYLRHCYLQNDLSNGRLEIDGVRLDLKKVKTPIYNLAAREDHIAPARSVFVGSAAFGGPVTYVMSGSGHIAGVVNPPSLKKYQYWTGGPVKGSFDDWVSTAKETPGSWWPHWREWIRSHDGKEVKALKPGAGPFKAIEDAPGRYVKVKS